jgi:catechol 2,3-dioxygenase-like lactoylglutathione lyase family enzyme
MAEARLVSITIDCAEAAPVARFYEQLLGMERVADDGDWAQLRNQPGGITLNVQAEEAYVPPVWPEVPGEQAKMLHFEVLVDDLEAAVAVAVAAGGSEAPWQPPDRDQARIRIVLDPSGHPLCLFVEGE